MDRRDFLRTAGGIGAATAGTMAATTAADAGALAAPGITKANRDIRTAMAWPDSDEGPAHSARRLAQRIETATSGRYRFHFVDAAKTGIAAIAGGEADAYLGSEHDNRAFSAGFAYFAGLPGLNGLRASALDAWLSAGDGQALWDELASAFEVKAMLAGHTGRSIGLLSRSAIASLPDLSGKRIWTLGLGADVVRGLGGLPVLALPADVARDLNDGGIDAAEAGGALASRAFGVIPHAQHGNGITINRGGTALSLGLSRRLWMSMTAADQTIIAAICSAELHQAIADEKAHRHQLAMPLRSTKVGSPPRDIANAVDRVSDAVVAHLAATDAATQRINSSYVAFRRSIGLERPVSTSSMPRRRFPEVRDWADRSPPSRRT